MSWIMNPEGDGGGRAQRPAKPPARNDTSSPGAEVPASPWEEFPNNDKYPKVPDPADADRLVSTKQANRPFLAWSQHKEDEERKKKEWSQRKKEREEKLAHGEPVGPEEADPTEEREVGCLGLLKILLLLAVFALLAGKFITGSYIWELEVPNLQQFVPTNQRLFSEGTLATYDGSSENKPIYLAIDGDVYDVTAGRRTYGPGGPYHMMAGRDAARAYGTGCFETHLTHDLRGLSEEEMKGVQHWRDFYAKSKKYVKVGRVSHPPIDPASPVPEHCDPKKAKQQAPWVGKQGKEKAVESHREEL